ncbi:hypothetical protein CYLTODRAFT_420746 [Cylindrobasidium torrendii FP15055 ss-10]|uniref:Large ribosomal subunit protein mL40 n=1 Tax=Cylindrobasidium torrendii FP15055 ss-10 TaxID=1314674 RepID=A0A0D7BFT1_9AGAR|nr:hypothetical protein CYLTODRAFT_420746 [Cylindrobasidium torrendii FP15055 ss-10]
MSGSRRAVSAIKIFARGYAKRPEDSIDPTKEIIRRTMYPSNIRNRSSPHGGWRHDAGRAIKFAMPSKEAHETIERGYMLYKRHLRKTRDAEIARKFAAMRDAMETLAEIDPHLYQEANKKEDLRQRLPAEEKLAKSMKMTQTRALDARIRGLFPRELRVPTDTPSRNGWNYTWNPFPRPL